MITLTKNELLNELNELKKQLDSEALEFAFDYDIDNSSYFCDAFSEFADANTSIYYYDIIQYISNNVEAVNNAIAEFGWEGCGSDLYKAGQMAEYLQIEQTLYNNFDDIKTYLIYKYLIDNDINITSVQLDDILTNSEDIDNNNYISDLLDVINEVIDN